jgi:hypothetical protein
MSMTPRLMVVCLGGLAGAGAVVCCDLDEGVEEIQAQADSDGADGGPQDAEPVEGESEVSPLH